jgi:hypothetical protein
LRFYDVDRSSKDNDGVSVGKGILLRKDYESTRKDNLYSDYAKLVSVSNTLRAISNDMYVVLFNIIAIACGEGNILRNSLDLTRK